MESGDPWEMARRADGSNWTADPHGSPVRLRVNRRLIPLRVPARVAARLVVGALRMALGIGYITIAWRLRRDERWVWTAAMVLPIVHVAAMSVLDLVLVGEIPSENYPVIGLVAVILVLLLIPTTRRFFTR